jgi:hypothetical protein
MRLRSCASTLSRSAREHEQTLTKRLACDQPDGAQLLAEPVNDVADPVVDDTLLEVRAESANYRNRLYGVRPAGSHPARPDSAKPSWGSETMESLEERISLPQPGTPPA